VRLYWDPAQERRRHLFREFAEQVVSPGAAARDEAGEFDRELWKALAAEGFWTAHLPGRYGGEDGGLWDFLAGLEGLSEGSADFGFVLSAIAHAGLVQVLLTHGTEEQRRRWLPVLSGGAVGATAATEAAGGSHVAAVRTAARRTADGYTLTGEKVHITNAPVADAVLVVGRIPELGRRDITLFVLAGDAPGLRRGAHEDLLGQRTSPTGPLTLDRVRVGADAVVGPPGEGLATLYSFLAFDRLMYGLAVAGQLERHVRVAVGRARSRSAFGQPLAEHEFIQDKLVDMKLTAEASRYLSYAAADALVRDDTTYSTLASCAKLTASEGIVRAGYELVQIFGHAGYQRGTGVERVLRDAVAIRIAGGTTEMQKKNIFKHLSGAS
jgi:alkylation response protein AidB-like acyl-CoA dehydrogenase